MEKLVRIDTDVINKGNPDKFPLQRVCKDFSAGYEYQVEGSWVAKPNQKPEKTRVIFNLDAFRAARDTYFAWQELSLKKVDNPVKPETAIQRIGAARLTGEELTLFVPWGVRPEGNRGLNELAVLNKLKSIKNTLQQRKINAQILIMPADLYATEINQIDPLLAGEYFGFIEKAARERGFTVKPWSAIREENWQIYKERSLELTKEEIQKLSYPVIESALSAARKRSGYTNAADIERSAFTYLRERICEAEIIEKVYKPVKISAVAKNKDNDVDRNLPRLYLIPRDYQFPWLK